MTKIREILEKYAEEGDIGDLQRMHKRIYDDQFDKLEKELQEYVDKNYHKIYGSHDVEEYYKDDEENDG